MPPRCISHKWSNIHAHKNLMTRAQKQPQNGGKDCPPLTETQSCPVKACHTLLCGGGEQPQVALWRTGVFSLYLRLATYVRVVNAEELSWPLNFCFYCFVMFLFLLLPFRVSLAVKLSGWGAENRGCLLPGLAFVSPTLLSRFSCRLEHVGAHTPHACTHCRGQGLRVLECFGQSDVIEITDPPPPCPPPPADIIKGT